ncbi:MAG: undecaprenyldiphospho-muramoylpentapeptide beta-N-acetylglucosaminyltransferase [Acidobacteria bacterium]|nr:undecaprenyldiphospho-muramoylpentapeptide beta-N-acetylglucosaminyltransferase [Acidobacteriota bacterium]
MSLSVLIAGGGTGGHLYPGIAVARALLEQAPDTQVAFVGTAAGIEARVIPREGFALELIRAAGLKGKSIKALVRGMTMLPLGGLDAWYVISRRRPSMVVGVGGYSSGPVVMLAALRGIPTLLMEQNVVPGLTNRLLAPVVDAAAVTYEESVRFFGKKAFVSGNPVRPEFLHQSRISGASNASEDQPSGSDAVRLLVFGGSQGAHAINVAMVGAATRLAASSPQLRITHQTGERDLEMVREGYKRAGLDARVEAFLYEMDREMKAADLVVSRAGATTLAELAASGKASILVPLPTATDDHQRRNAEALVQQGAAVMVVEREFTGDRVANEILELARDPRRRSEIGTAARSLARPDAARVIAEKVVSLAR